MVAARLGNPRSVSGDDTEQVVPVGERETQLQKVPAWVSTSLGTNVGGVIDATGSWSGVSSTLTHRTLKKQDGLPG